MLALTKISLGILAAAATFTLAGCAARAKTTSANPASMKPAAPVAPTPPPALSVPQTQVELPKPQPYDRSALDTAPAVPADAAASKPPATTTPPRNPRQTTRTDTPPPPPPVTPTEAARPQVQEIISAPDLKRLQDSAQSRKKEVAGIMNQFQKRRGLSQSQKIKVGEVHNFVKLSDDFERRGEMRQADAMAEKAQILARELQNGK
jgi:hypothetical protein